MKYIRYLIILGILFIPFGVWAHDDMKITMIQSNGKHGDSVLLESNGEYLLMDTFSPDSNITGFLAERKIFNLSIYISHYHLDHYGGLIDLLKDNRFTIKKIYLPKTEYFCHFYSADKAQSTPDFPNFYPSIKTRFDKIIEKKIPYEFLWPSNTTYPNEKHCLNLKETSYTNKIKIGNATINVIGPVKTFTLNDISGDSIRVKENRYINNHSLVSIIEAGGIRYYTGGDIAELGENELVKAINEGKINISADIMKVSHHSAAGSNNMNLVKKINPKYAFVLNTGTKSASEVKTLVPLINKETNCQNNCYSGTNMWKSFYNGTTSFIVRDRFIYIESKNSDKYRSIKFNYYDSNTNQKIGEKSFLYSIGTPFYINQDYKKYNGYIFEKMNGELPTSKTLDNNLNYNVYMKKVDNNTSVISTPTSRISEEKVEKNTSVISTPTSRVSEEKVEIPTTKSNNIVVDDTKAEPTSVKSNPTSLVKEVVEVPNTNSNNSMILYFVAFGFISLSMTIIINYKKRKDY